MAFSWTGGVLTCSIASDITLGRVKTSQLKTELEQAIVAVWPTSVTRAGDTLTVTYAAAPSANRKSIVEARVTGHNRNVAPAEFYDHWGSDGSQINTPAEVEETWFDKTTASLAEGYYEIGISVAVDPPIDAACNLILYVDEVITRQAGGVTYEPNSITSDWWGFRTTIWWAAGTHRIRITFDTRSAVNDAEVRDYDICVERKFPSRNQLNEGVGAGPA